MTRILIYVFFLRYHRSVEYLILMTLSQEFQGSLSTRMQNKWENDFFEIDFDSTYLNCIYYVPLSTAVPQFR